MAIASPKNKEELIRQFKFNPEVDTRLEAFMKAKPGLVQFVKELPREQLERKFLLRKMRDGVNGKAILQRSRPGSKGPSRPSW